MIAVDCLCWCFHYSKYSIHAYDMLQLVVLLKDSPQRDSAGYATMRQATLPQPRSAAPWQIKLLDCCGGGTDTCTRRLRRHMAGWLTPAQAFLLPSVLFAPQDELRGKWIVHFV